MCVYFRREKNNLAARRYRARKAQELADKQTEKDRLQLQVHNLTKAVLAKKPVKLLIKVMCIIYIE